MADLDVRQRPQLTESQRVILAEIMARPGLSDSQVARAFEARTGRKINRCSVQKRRREGPYKARPGNGHITEAERRLLHELIRESEGEASYREIAGQFEAIAGRRITFQTPWWHATRVLGLPGVGKGHGPKLETAATGLRLAAASARKLASAKVDRSIRVGRSGRDHSRAANGSAPRQKGGLHG